MDYQYLRQADRYLLKKKFFRLLENEATQHDTLRRHNFIMGAIDYVMTHPLRSIDGHSLHDNGEYVYNHPGEGILFESQIKGANPEIKAKNRDKLFQSIMQIISPSHGIGHKDNLPPGNDWKRPLNKEECFFYSWEDPENGLDVYLTPKKHFNDDVEWELMAVEILPENYETDESGDTASNYSDHASDQEDAE